MCNTVHFRNAMPFQHGYSVQGLQAPSTCASSSVFVALSLLTALLWISGCCSLCLANQFFKHVKIIVDCKYVCTAEWTVNLVWLGSFYVITQLIETTIKHKYWNWGLIGDCDPGFHMINCIPINKQLLQSYNTQKLWQFIIIHIIIELD